MAIFVPIFRVRQSLTVLLSLNSEQFFTSTSGFCYFVIFEYSFSVQAVLEVVLMGVRRGNFHAGCLKVGAIDFQWPLFAKSILKLSAILFHRHKRCRLRD